MNYPEAANHADIVDRCPECQGLLGKTHHGVRDCEECGARFDAEDMENGEVS